MFDGLWAGLQAMLSGDLFWCFMAAAVAFSAEFAVKYSLFPRVGMDRRWAYSFGLSSGILAFGVTYQQMFEWFFLFSLYNQIPSWVLFSKRFSKSPVYMRSYTGSLSMESMLYSLPVLGFVISCVELFSFSKLAKKFFYQGEISADHPGNAILYASTIIVVSSAIIIVIYF